MDVQSRRLAPLFPLTSSARFAYFLKRDVSSGRLFLFSLSHAGEERLRPAAAVRRLPAAGEAATAEEEGCHLFIISTYGRTRLRLFSSLTSAVCVFESSTSPSDNETPKDSLGEEGTVERRTRHGTPAREQVVCVRRHVRSLRREGASGSSGRCLPTERTVVGQTMLVKE